MRTAWQGAKGLLPTGGFRLAHTGAGRRAWWGMLHSRVVSWQIGR
jgi:hypothetical protein